ncbi:MAG TPA: DNA cytosine methyltransferase [Bryobacteraceae bacterium]|nr:DNA cytosine methyltransferase [Bryobacteraceae bacterium]
MTYGSVCSGIEAVTVAWQPLGFRPAWFAEIDPFCSALLTHRYPDVPNLGNFTTIKRSCDPIDVLAGGTPCQSFSLAGRRGGLEDARGNLAIEFCRLAGRLRPRWIVWENVPGVLSSNGGRDFGSIVGALAELGFGCAWRVLDTQFFGVPQRRRRVFVVGHLGDWRRAAAVLLEREGLCRHTPARRQTGEGITHDLAPSLTRSGRGVERNGDSRGQDPVVAVHHTTGDGYWHEGAGTLRARKQESHEHLVASTGNISHCLNGGGMHRIDYETETLVTAFSAKDHGADAGPLAPTLRAMPHDRSHANAGGQIAVCFESRVARNGRGGPSEVVPPLKAQSGGTGRGDAAPLLAVGGPLAVRRLTPRECERLQGMPDDYTLIPCRGKPAADGPRYRAIGNSMAVPVMRWIGRRIQMVDSIG